MKTAIRKALDHVHSLHPEITMLIFSPSGKWLFCDDDFETPPFNTEKVDIGLLEDAANVAEWPSIHPL